MNAPTHVKPLAEEILRRLAQHDEASEIVLGGYFALQRDTDFCDTNEIGAWWRSRASAVAVAAIRELMTSVACEIGYQLRERTSGDMIRLNF